MKPYRLHMFICQGKHCSARGSEEILEIFKERVKAEGLKDVKISKSGCLKVCKETENEGGFCPGIVIYPQGVWYRNVTKADINDIMDKHLKKGAIVERLLLFKL